MYLTCALLTNARTCLYGNPISCVILLRQKIILCDVKSNNCCFHSPQGSTSSSSVLFSQPRRIALILHLCVKYLLHKTSRHMMNVFTLQRPTCSHQVGIQNTFRFHVHRIISGLFYENSTELDEVGSSWFFLELTVNCPKFVVLFWTIDDPNQPNYSQA